MSKIIGIDVYSALHKPRGMGIYTINFLQELAKLDKENNYILYSDIEDFNNVLPKQSNFKHKILRARGLFHYEQVVLPKECKKDRIDILHSPANTSPIFLNKNIKRVISIHDVIFMKKEVKFSRNLKQILGRAYYILTAILNSKKACAIITPTQYSKEDIARTLHIDKNIILVDSRGHEHFNVLNATQLINLQEHYNIPKEYFFHIGGDAPSKNTDFLLKIFTKNKKNIVVAGIKNLEQSSLYNKYKKYDNIHFVAYIQQSDIVGLYKYAIAFIFPSLYEGFGLPLLEAMKCNCPILSSNATCLPEVAKNAALYFSPRDEKFLIEIINKIYSDKTLQKTLKEKQIDTLKNYSWQNCAKVIANIYQNV